MKLMCYIVYVNLSSLTLFGQNEQKSHVIWPKKLESFTCRGKQLIKLFQKNIASRILKVNLIEIEALPSKENQTIWPNNVRQIKKSFGQIA